MTRHPNTSKSLPRVAQLAAITAVALVFAPPPAEGQTSDRLAACRHRERHRSPACYDDLVVTDRLAELEAEKAQMRGQYGPRHPEMIRINAAIERARDQVEAERAQPR